MRKSFFAWLLVIFLLLFTTIALAAEYDVRDLGDWQPYDINNSGEIVGVENSKPILWKSGIKTIISDLNGFAFAINDAGQVVGKIGSQAVVSESGQKAFFWENGNLTYLQVNGVEDNCYAKDINDHGKILGGKVGNMNNLFGELSTVGYWENGNYTLVRVSSPPIPWANIRKEVYANRINNLGDIVGYCDALQGSYDVVVYTGQSSGWTSGENLPAIPGLPYFGGNLFAWSQFVIPKIINDNKQIAGQYPNFISDTNGVLLVDFDVAANNNSNIVVGKKDGYACIYDNSGDLKNLNDLIDPIFSGWVLESALAINDKGEIVCQGRLNGLNRVCLLTPFLSYELAYSGTEFPVNYKTYGTFSNQNTANYNYGLNDSAGLSAAVGEGIYPNTQSILLNPLYQFYLSNGKLDGDIWSFVNSDNPWADFFKWSTAVGVQEGEKLFYTALALENAGQFQHAVKAYYAIIVHFPFTKAYIPNENIYWYPGIAAVDAINRLCTEHPELGYELINAKITVENGYNSNPVDDIFTANSGEFQTYSLQDRIDRSAERINAIDLDMRGNGRVQVIKRSDNSWQMRVDNKPFKVQGITYSPTQVGMTADDQTAWQWLDTNDNQLIDAAQEAWVDTNRNNLQDADEPTIGDFQLLKDMGCNTIRIFHYAGADKKTYQPTEYNKPLLRQLYQKYGIMVMMGDFFGGYTIGSGATWENGTDYTNPEQRAAMKEVVRQMVLDHKDEPYVLMWLLGNENNMASEYNGINGARTNAATQPQAYAEFLNEVAQMIHAIDPDHPVAVGNLNLGLVEYYAQYAPELDIIATNHYTDRFGLGVSYLREAREKIDRPLIIAEYGVDAYHQGQGINELEQKNHHLGGWKAIAYNGSTTPGEGNLLGGIIFEWTDEWWKAQSEYDSPWIQEIASQFYWGIMPDNFCHEEWFGICGQGDGSQSPFLRQPRSAYDLYKQLWIPESSFDEITGFVRLGWDSYPGLTYTLQYSADNQTWLEVATDIKPSLNGRITWTDNGSQTGGIPFSRHYYRVSINGSVPLAYVLETFSGLNHVPVANDQEIELKKNEAKAFSFTAWDPDNDTLSYIILKQLEHGTLSGIAPDLIYTPDTDYIGIDTFSYIASDGIDKSEVAHVNFYVNTFAPGNGLQAEYYNTMDFNYWQVTRSDNTVDFNWVSGLPELGIDADTFSVRWSGQVLAQYDQTYTFYTVSDDGVRLWVNGQMLINNWTDHTSTENSGTITLAAGQKYDIVMEYYQNEGGAEARLFWSSASTPKQIIPHTHLYHSLESLGDCPIITSQPQDMSIPFGQSATFNVIANGRTFMHYQWYKNDEAIDGAVFSSYTIPVAVDADNGAVFKVVVYTVYAETMSENAVLTVTPLSAVNAAAVFVNTDTATQGNWIGQYGADGYNVISDTGSYPYYAQVSTSRSAQWVWNSATTNVSALRKAVGSDRIAGCWYGSPSQDIRVDIKDGQTHQVAIYCLDWESSTRRQTVEVLDAVSGAVLDTQALNNAFTNGVYLVWNIRGSVIIRVKQTGSDNAVISGIFFGNSAAGIAPSITAQPQAATVIAGQTAAFNVTASGSDPLTYQWYKNDIIIEGATAVSYTTPALVLADNGTRFQVSITNNNGTIISNPAVLTVNPAGSTVAGFVKKDIITQGNWIGQYGSDGYNIIGNTVNYPNYAQVSPSRSGQWVWNSSTTNASALRKAVGSDRIAGCWYGAPSHDIAVNINDGNFHQVAIYCLDWESSTRRQTVEVLDAVSGAVLDTQALNTAFTNGVYLVWNIRGSIIIRVKQTSYDNAVISGIFFGNSVAGIAPSITAQPQVATVIAGQTAAFNVTASGSDTLRYQWYKNDGLINGATTASYTTGATLLADNGAVFKVNISNDYGTITSNPVVLTVNPASTGVAHFVSADPATHGNWIGTYGTDGYNIIGNTVNYPSYAQVSTSGSGQWVWNASTTNISALRKVVGTDRIAGCWYGSPSYDIRLNIAGTHQVAIYCLDWNASQRSQRVEVLDAGSGAVLDTRELYTASFAGGVYLAWNISGSVIIRVTQTGSDNAVISGIFFGPVLMFFIPPSITAQPQDAVVRQGQTAAFNVTASGSDPLTYQWYKNDVLISGATAASYTTSAVVLADNGARFKVTVNNGSGIITSNAAALTVTPAGTAVFVNTDTITQGDWIGKYGANGYNIIGNSVNYPSYAQVSTSRSGQWVWNSATTNISALRKSVGTDRIAGCWYGAPSHDIQVNITDGQTHKLAIYCLDWQSSVRRQRVEVLDAVSGAVLDTRQLNTAFTGGVYLAWNIRGSVIIRVTQTGSDNAVISGLFFN